MGRPVIDLIGQKFGILTVIEYKGSNYNGVAQWNCKCDCGNSLIVLGSVLRKKHTKSCGCLNYKKITYQGETKSLKEWSEIKGIKYHTLYTRIHNKGLTAKEALEINKHKNYFTYKGETKSLAEWAKLKNIKHGTLYSRIYDQKLTIEKALEVNKHKNYFTYKGEAKLLIEWAKIKNIRYTTLLYRINKQNMSIDEALELKKTKNNRLTFQGETRSLAEWAKIKNIQYAALYRKIHIQGLTAEKALEAPQKERKKQMNQPIRASWLIVIVNVFWDSDAEVWVATSKDLLGLATESVTYDALIEKLKIMIPEILDLNL